MKEIFVIALAVSAASVTVTQSAIFRWLRNLVDWRLLRCPYCFSHWLAILGVAAIRPSWWLPVEALAVVAMAGVSSLFLVELLSRTDE